MNSETSVRTEQGQARPVCPRCESLETLPTLYGLPALSRRVREGKIAIMGCDLPLSAVWGDIPKFECQVCRLAF